MTTIKRESRGPVWDKPFPDLQLCFCPNFLWFCWLTLVAFGEFIFENRLKQSKVLDVQHRKFFYSPSVLIFFPQMQRSFPSVLPKRVYPVSMRMHKQSTQWKPAKNKRTSRGKVSKRSSTTFSKTYNLEAKKRYSGVRKRLTAQYNYYSSRH